MPPSPVLVVLATLGALAYLGALYGIDNALSGARRVYFRYAALIVTIGLFAFGVQRVVPALNPNLKGTDLLEQILGVTKAAIGIAAVSCLFYEQHRAGMKRPVAERWKRIVGITLGLAAIVSYHHFFQFPWPQYYHRHDQYHYYLGAKYFPEIGYGRIYECTVIAQDELGVIVDEQGNHVDVTKEGRLPDRKIRNLRGDYLLMPAAGVLEHPEECRSRFSPERWAAFKDDIRFFRSVSDRGFYEQMQKDNGFNPPPVWMLAGRFFASMFPAGHKLLGFYWLQWLAMLDNVLVAGMFGALFWAFGWRVFAIAAVFWGCNAAGDDYFVSGAFLRQDWLFFFVLAACLARKRWYALSGASIVYAALLRIFPGLAVVGWLVVAGAYVARHKRMAKHHQRTLLGGVLAAAVLLPASLQLCGKDSYAAFYHHTLEALDRTPLTNHMGLRVLVAHKVGTGPSSGRAKYVADDKLPDPFGEWKRMRNERWDRYKGVAYAIVALSFAFFAWVVRRVRSMWIALCLGQIFIILMAQLLSYYYAFMVITAPLTRARRQLEVPLLGLAVVSQLVWRGLGYFDDKSAALTLISLVFCYWLVCAFAPAGSFKRVLSRFRAASAPPPG